MGEGCVDDKYGVIFELDELVELDEMDPQDAGSVVDTIGLLDAAADPVIPSLPDWYTAFSFW